MKQFVIHSQHKQFNVAFPDDSDMTAAKLWELIQREKGVISEGLVVRPEAILAIQIAA